MSDIEKLARSAVDCGLEIHRDLGPGLLESAYEALLAHALIDRGLRVERQKLVALEYKNVRLEDVFRADLVVEGELLIEVKSLEQLAPVHSKQVLTYLRLLKLPLGLLMNFGGPTFKGGVHRVLNMRADTTRMTIWTAAD